MRDHVRVLAAAVTIWLTFALWLAAPHVGVRPELARAAAVLLWAELVALLGWSYGCENGDCTPAADAMGAVARIDLPLITALLFAALAARARPARRPLD